MPTNIQQPIAIGHAAAKVGSYGSPMSSYTTAGCKFRSTMNTRGSKRAGEWSYGILLHVAAPLNTVTAITDIQQQ